MRFDRLQLLAVTAFLATAGACAPNTAENSFAVALNSSSPKQNGIVETRQPISFNLPEPTSDLVDHSTALTVDGHLGMWFNEWSGIMIDGPFPQADGSRLDNTVVSTTSLLLLRMHLFKSHSVPDGQLQPYLGIGPGIFFPNQNADVGHDISSTVDTADMAVGVDLRAGMNWRLSDRLSIFGEYRMTHYKTDRSKAVPYLEENGDTAPTTNHFMGGLKWEF